MAKARKKTKTKKATKKATKTPARTSGKTKSLLVVESPAKARTLKKYLGSGFVVKASIGHIKDLPKSRMGVDLLKNFRPEYVVLRNKAKVIDEIRHAAGTVDKVFLGPDPDREGEAIAFHIADEIKHVNTNVHRVLINEITKKGVNEALAHPTTLNANMYDAQQARRILDRIVGYKVSPILWNKVKRGLSAGRVQSVAVRIVVEREREIKAFVPQEYWTIDVDCVAVEPPPFEAKLHRWDGEKIELGNEFQATEIAAEVRGASLVVDKVERKERRRNPLPPFITSKLQQEAARKLRFTAKKTMALAQLLYEGVDLGEEGPVGLITYMRTDSVRLSDDAVSDARAYIERRFGKDFLPAEPNVYKSAKQSQGGHEAIRPTSLQYDPDTVRKLLLEPLMTKETEGAHHVTLHEKLDDYDDALRLYTLIWNRFLACQMAPAVYDQTAVDITAGRATLRATGQVMKFAGYTQVYLESEGDDDAREEGDKILPPLAVGDPVTATSVRPEQHFTTPPPRFSEASLVKELEEKGIGRPSTYASILSTVQDRGYVEKREARFYPTELGTLVNDLLVESFPDIFNVDFTAQMEERLDKVEEGEEDWVKLLRRFYGGEVDARRQAGGDPHRLHLREMRFADDHQVGAERVVPGLLELPRVQEHQGVSAPRRRLAEDHRREDHRREMRRVRGRDEGQAGAIRRVSGLLALPRMQGDQAGVDRRALPARGVRRVLDRQAVQAGKDLLRLLQLLQDQVRLRELGSADPRALPAVRRALPGEEGAEERHHGAVPPRRLRLPASGGGGRGGCGGLTST